MWCALTSTRKGKRRAMAISGVYIIRCLTTNRIYVGSSGDIERRFKAHKGGILHKQHSSELMTELDINNVTFEIIEEMPNTTRKERIRREQHYMDVLHPELNKHKKASSGFLDGEQHPMAVAVICLNDSKIFGSATYASLFYGIKTSECIINVCAKRRKHTFGYSFEYLDSPEGYTAAVAFLKRKRLLESFA
jgi:predicted GIY-YIG superfamily endonuclease